MTYIIGSEVKKLKTKDNCIENKVVLFPYTIAEQVDEQNCLERASEQRENKLLNMADCLTEAIDMLDGIKGNDFRLNRLKDLINAALKENTYQYGKNLQQQKHLDNLIPFPEHAQNKKSA
jgi:hypothetical protein